MGNSLSSRRQAGQVSWSHVADEETEAQGGWGVCAGSQAGHVGSGAPSLLGVLRALHQLGAARSLAISPPTGAHLVSPQRGMRLRCSGLTGDSESTA